MAEEKKFETAEELGEAVGEKIDKLFGGSTSEAPDQGAVRPDTQTVTQPTDLTAQTRSAPEEGGEPAQPSSLRSKEQLLDRLEALALKLEWEASIDTIREMGRRFKEMERYLPQDGPAPSLITMNRRVLRRFGRPDVSPHPKLVKLLQDSTSAMRQLGATGDREQLADGLISSIVKTYNEIMGFPKPADVPADAEKGPEMQDVGALISHMSGAVNSLAEVGQRLAKIRADVTQGGEMSEEEMAGKLKRLERLFADRIGQLSSLHRKLSRLAPLDTTTPSAPQKRLDQGEPSPDGLLMIEWNGHPVAEPSSLIVALYPLTRSQAQQLKGKTS
ncbi:MAG: hypothetical protein P8182_20215, partial [Deltaproteobacteria bacterium]